MTAFRTMVGRRLGRAAPVALDGRHSRPAPFSLHSAARRLAVEVLCAIVVLSTVPHHALATDNVDIEWASYSANTYTSYIRWKFDPGFPTINAMRTYVENGREEWNKVNRELLFSWWQNEQYPKVWVRHNDLWFPAHNALAVAFANTGWSHNDGEARILNGEITFNNSPDNGWRHWYGQTASPSCIDNYIDIWSTSAHEFGHLVALGHSTTYADTMYETIPCGHLNARSLTAHDMAGIKALYPPHQ